MTGRWRTRHARLKLPPVRHSRASRSRPQNRPPLTAERKLAAAWHSRIASLHERRSATTQELDEAEARLSSAVARAESASARVAQANAQLAAARAAADAATTAQSFGLVKAPFDGLVTERLTDPGNLASPGIPLLRLDSTGAPHVEVRVDEARERYVREGDRVEVRFEEGAGASRAVEGVVTEIARAVTADERAFMVEVSLPSDHTPRTGTFARVRFRGAEPRGTRRPVDAPSGARGSCRPCSSLKTASHVCDCCRQVMRAPKASRYSPASTAVR